MIIKKDHSKELVFFYELPVASYQIFYCHYLLLFFTTFRGQGIKSGAENNPAVMRKSLVCIRILMMVDIHLSIFFFYGYILFSDVLFVFIGYVLRLFFIIDEQLAVVEPD